MELLGRRDDGYHEIDTVMVPIDWRDQLEIKRTHEARIDLQVGWIPSQDEIADELGIPIPDRANSDLLLIPDDRSNLVYRALERFQSEFSIPGGFRVRLHKSIPAGAGMGGASSDAAAVLRCAAVLCQIDSHDQRIIKIASDIGSDVPFFLGCGPNHQPTLAARATGRGEILESIEIDRPIDFVVAFPSLSLSTALVYANSQIPAVPKTADDLVMALASGDFQSLQSTLLNRLTSAAEKVGPQIQKLLESMWRLGARTAQLTGSGSACFAIMDSPQVAMATAARIEDEIHGVRTKAVSSVAVPSEVELTRLS